MAGYRGRIVDRATVYGGCNLPSSRMAAPHPQVNEGISLSGRVHFDIRPTVRPAAMSTTGSGLDAGQWGRSCSRNGGSATAGRLLAEARIGLARKQTGHVSLAESTGISLEYREMAGVAMGAVVSGNGRVECGRCREGVGQCVVSIDLVLGEMAPAVEEEIEREGSTGHGNEWRRSPSMLVPSSIAHYRHGKRDQGACSGRPGTT